MYFLFAAPYCKKLYLDVTSSNYGKITWDTVKPIIQGKILFAPNTADSNTIMSLVRIFDKIFEYYRRQIISNDNP